MKKKTLGIFTALLLLSAAASAQEPAAAPNRINIDSLNRAGFRAACDDLYTEMKKYKTQEDSRVDCSFHFGWAFHNWGASPFEGMSKLSGPYSLRTTFSSYQLELVWDVRLCRHFAIGAGVGYESDVYKFADSYVTYVSPEGATAGSFLTVNVTGFGGHSTRLVARYVGLPISFKWLPAKKFSVSLTVIPALNYNGKNTGLKHRGEFANDSYTDREGLVSVMRPFKMDARLAVGYGDFSVFWQVSPFPVFRDMEQDCYPMKLGFMLSL